MTPRCLAIGIAMLVPFAAQAADSLRPLSDRELSEVHAAGLPDTAVQQLTAGAPISAMLPLELAAVATPELSQLERQQSLTQLKLASAATQGSLGALQLASLPMLATPFAPLFLPALALPFPFFMAPPPKKHDAGH